MYGLISISRDGQVLWGARCLPREERLAVLASIIAPASPGRISSTQGCDLAGRHLGAVLPVATCSQTHLAWSQCKILTFGKGPCREWKQMSGVDRLL